MSQFKEETISLGKSLRSFLVLFSNYKNYIILTLIIAFIVEGAQIIDKFILKYFVDIATLYTKGDLYKGDFLQSIIELFLILLLVIIIRTSGRWLLMHRGNIISTGMAFDLKNKLFNHILQLPTEFHTNHKSGTMIARMMRAGASIESIVDVFIFSLIPITIQIITVVGSLIVLNFSSAIIVIIYTITFLGYSYIIQIKQVDSQSIYNLAEDREKGFISDSITNIESIKLYAKEDYIGKKFFLFNTSTREKLIIFWGWWRWSDAGLIGITGIAILAITFLSGYQFYQGKIELGTLVFTYSAILTMAAPLQTFQWGMRGLYRGLGDFESLRVYLDEKNEIVDPKNSNDFVIAQGSISFQNVGFHYSKKNVFKNLTLEIPAQMTVALVGKSGSGKSTLIKLLFRLYDAESGGIFIDGINIKDIKQQSLRSSLSIVPQDCILFDDSLYNNILFSNPSATREEVTYAIHLAQLDHVIELMPLKEDTIVGERGVKLSGGEKQRVSIARAILANKKILILDEATSALDSETEFAIKEAFNHLMKGKTCIIIAHRLSTIMNSDRIVVLRNGKIMQIGTHSELIKEDGEYKRLWNLQKRGYIK
jgi:subfamily B ATP-binding cassette protein MsbA